MQLCVHQSSDASELTVQRLTCRAFTTSAFVLRVDIGCDAKAMSKAFVSASVTSLVLLCFCCFSAVGIRSLDPQQAEHQPVTKTRRP